MFLLCVYAWNSMQTVFWTCLDMVEFFCLSLKSFTESVHSRMRHAVITVWWRECSAQVALEVNKLCVSYLHIIVIIMTCEQRGQFIKGVSSNDSSLEDSDLVAVTDI